MRYYPVIIPTLNRYLHFVRCLESLENCTGSEYTEVIVGLDYPPNEKYVDGWKQIDSYLIEKENNNRFKNLFVRRRMSNCGLYGKNSNYSLLVNEVVDKGYDAYIGTEDDNEFSPNFLEYMNQALELYADDSRVITISAYTPPSFQGLTNHSTFFGIDAPAYGIGIWLHKTPLIKTIDFGKYLKGLKFSKFIRLTLAYPALMSMAIHMVEKNVVWGDVLNSMNNLLFGTFTLQPTSSLARNWGADGSGARSGIVKGLEKEVIQGAHHFDMERIPHEYPPKLKRRCLRRNMPSNIIKFIHSWLWIIRRSLLYYFKKY